MSTSTADQLRRAACAVAAEEKDDDVLARVRVLRDGGRLPLQARDDLLFEILQRYRVGPRERWAAVLLDVMAPPLVERLKVLAPQPPAIDAADLAQEFLVEILEAALTIPIQRGSAFIERRLLLRARTAVVRTLQREARGRGWVEPLDALCGDAR